MGARKNKYASNLLLSRFERIVETFRVNERDLGVTSHVGDKQRFLICHAYGEYFKTMVVHADPKKSKYFKGDIEIGFIDCNKV